MFIRLLSWLASGWASFPGLFRRRSYPVDRRRPKDTFRADSARLRCYIRRIWRRYYQRRRFRLSLFLGI